VIPYKNIFSLLILSSVLFASNNKADNKKEFHKSITEKPNIILILVDDIGYGDIGIFGQEKIMTPEIDQLAADGMRFTQAYAGKCRLCTISIFTDGTHETHIGGHPEWAEGSLVIGSHKNNTEKKLQVLYDIDTKKLLDIGTTEMFPKPEGDVALSSDGNWFVNGYSTSGKNYYTIYRRSEGAFIRSKGIDKGEYSGDIRRDPAPRWNRTNDAILVPGIAPNGMRQMFVIKVIKE